MTYSSAYYGDETNDLYEAQQKKYARMAELAGVTKDSHVLEVGCGWGGFAEHAAGGIRCACHRYHDFTGTI
jgi:cyclopropane-fatty-acyl-phospholipid synthase